jgi:RNA polymerase sigma-70 factor (ECF subfamily)
MSTANLDNGISEINRDTFRMLYELYWNKVYSYAKRILEDEQGAEDVVQQVFVSLWERRTEIQIQHIEGYLIRSVKYVCLNQLKKRQRYTDSEQLTVDSKKSDLRTDDNILYQELERTIERLLGPFTHKCQEMFRMRFQDGLDNQSIATHFDLSEKTIRNKLSITIGAIREKLKTAGYK